MHASENSVMRYSALFELFILQWQSIMNMMRPGTTYLLPVHDIV